MKKKYLLLIFILCICIAVIMAIPMKNTSDKNKIERINYKLINRKGEPSLYNVIDSNEIELYLKITPQIKEQRPAAYTIFMNGEQIECQWNDEKTKIFKKTVYPDRNDVIKIVINNIPNGLNTFQIGTVYFPDKNNWTEEELENTRYSIDFNSFTIISNQDIKNKSNISFEYKKELFNNNESDAIAIIDGDITYSKEEIIIQNIYYLNKSKIAYYHWKNTDDKVRKVRFSLLVNWKQVEWPDTGELFIDSLAYPNDYLIKKLELSAFEDSQIAIVAFLDPDEPFWYYDKNDPNNRIKANYYGSIAFSTDRTIIKK